MRDGLERAIEDARAGRVTRHTWRTEAGESYVVRTTEECNTALRREHVTAQELATLRARVLALTHEVGADQLSQVSPHQVTDLTPDLQLVFRRDEGQPLLLLTVRRPERQ